MKYFLIYSYDKNQTKVYTTCRVEVEEFNIDKVKQALKSHHELEGEVMVSKFMRLDEPIKGTLSDLERKFTPTPVSTDFDDVKLIFPDAKQLEKEKLIGLPVKPTIQYGKATRVGKKKRVIRNTISE